MRFLHGAWGSFLDFLASTCTHYEEVLFNVRGFIRESFGWWDCATWMHNARCRRSNPARGRELAGTETEPWEIICFKLYKSQIPVIEQALETAALMLGSDKSRGYCLDLICADFVIGANLDSAGPEVLLRAVARVFQFLPTEQKNEFLHHAIGNAA